MTHPTIITIPCLSGAPWDLDSFGPLSDYPLATLRLSDEHTDIESHASDVLDLASRHGEFILAGDSFGAQVAIAAAARRPKGLVGLVISGGFAAMPIDSFVTRMKINAARFLPGPLYRHLVLPMHAKALESRFDAEGDNAWSTRDSERLFLANTPWKGYVRRTQAALAADYTSLLRNIEVPTLILTPQDDTLIGPDAARVLRDGIGNSVEVVLERTGHMFRLSHPTRYAEAIRDFFAVEHKAAA
jgi:pimeloyl-ACP methyl ester carboxylesterase